MLNFSLQVLTFARHVNSTGQRSLTYFVIGRNTAQMVYIQEPMS